MRLRCGPGDRRFASGREGRSPDRVPNGRPSIRALLLVAIAERDHIVPGGSAHALATVPGIEVEVLSCATGHVSMIAGSGGRNQVWPKLSDWLEKRQAPKKMDESRMRQL